MDIKIFENNVIELKSDPAQKGRSRLFPSITSIPFMLKPCQLHSNYYRKFLKPIKSNIHSITTHDAPFHLE